MTTGWIPVNDPLPPDDFHTWARPAPEPCPNCVCCSKALCELANQRDAAGDWNGACHHLGGPSDYDLSECPCWRDRAGRLPLAADHPYRKAESGEAVEYTPKGNGS